MKIKWHKETAEKMLVNNVDGVVYFTYPMLEKLSCVIHGFSSRLGGVSEGDCSSMNLSFSRGDKEENVWENYRRISNALGFQIEQIVTSDQTHTTNVKIISAEDKGSGIIKPKKFHNVDGMITNEPGVVLATFYADCVPLYFIDPVKKAIGLSHSGWRGTAGKIGAETIRKMKENYGCNPADIYAAIGPSICVNCYEVSEDVIEKFAEVYTNSQIEQICYKKENGKYQLDLWEANRIVLLEEGILEEHISMPNLCTCCNPEVLFSHRASQGKRGNLAAFLALKEE